MPSHDDVFTAAERDQMEARLKRTGPIDLEKREITIPLNVLAELLDANAMIEHGHVNGDADLREEGIEQHHQILHGLGLNEDEITEIDDAAAVAGDAWRPNS
jgi:hypothetical protein